MSCKTSACKLCRREGVKLFLKASRCETSKCALTKRNFPPGQHPWARTRHSEYRTQLREKQRLKRFYGVPDRQFGKYFEWASRMAGNTGENLLVLLERRLDNAVFALGFTTSRRGARQLITHGHVALGPRIITVPGYEVGNSEEATIMLLGGKAHAPEAEAKTEESQPEVKADEAVPAPEAEHTEAAPEVIEPTEKPAEAE